MKTYGRGIIEQKGLHNITLKLREEYRTVYSVGDKIDGYGIYELTAPTMNEPSLCVKLKNKPVAFLKELEIPNKRILVKPVERVPWMLCNEPLEYESREKLFEKIKQCLETFLETPKPEDLTIITSWIMHTWIIEKFETTPYLQFFGAHECGKTRALELLQQLSFRGWLASNVTAPNLYRPVENWRPTLLLDESESFVGRPEVISILNSGYKKGLVIPRQTQTPDGTFQTEWFDVFSAKSLAGTQDLSTTTKSRSITFLMHKATRKVPVFVDKEMCAELRNKLLKWRFDTLLAQESEGSEGNEPFSREGGIQEVAEKIGGRLAELFIPLYMTTPKNYRKEILDYTQVLSEQRTVELSISQEAIVLGAILQCYQQGMVHNHLILVKHIADKLNKETDYLDQWSNAETGRIIGRLGFERKHTSKGNALVWNQNLIEKLEKDPRYRSAFHPIEIDEKTDPSLAKGSDRSHPSQPDWLKKQGDVDE